MGSKRTKSIWMAALLGLSLSAGTATAKEEVTPTEAATEALSYSAGSAEAAVLERAQAYWAARMARSREVYSYYAPPELGGPERPRGEGGSLRYTEYEIKKVVVDGERAGVVVEVQTALPAQLAVKIPSRYSQFLKSNVTEEWNRIEDAWYKKPLAKGGLSRFMKRNRPAPAEDAPLAATRSEAEGSAQEKSKE